MQTVNYRKGLPAMAGCFLIWGFQPLYWYMCTALCGEIDTFFLMACRITWAAVCCLCILKVQGKLPQLWAVFKDKQVLKREIPASVFLFGDWLVYLCRTAGCWSAAWATISSPWWCSPWAR